MIPPPGLGNTVWQLAWGRVDALPEIWQQEPGLAIAPSAATAISPSRRFVVVGEAWLPLVGDAISLEFVAQRWERVGAKTWEELVGAFALAVWDRERQVLTLGRDRSGCKTLYYTENGATGWVSNQLRALRPYCSNQIDLIALRDYLTCAFVPGDRTLWQDVREVRPGTTVQLPEQTVTAYWTLQENVLDADQPLSWYGDRLRSLLSQVVQESLPEHEPVGVFLSGGLDSSCVTALAAKLHPSPVHTYSIHFGKDLPNELEFSNLVAQHCRTQHHILEIPFKTMWNALPETMAALDDPIGDPLTVPNLLLGRLAKESVAIVLNGEGGDPCFGGPKNQPMLINSVYHAITQQDPLQAFLISFQKCATDLPNLLQPEVWHAVQAEPSVFAADLYSNQRYLNRLMALNIKFKGADQILTKVNNLTRAAGIEARSPLFDQRIVELSMQIPPEYKLSGTQEKAVLKQAVADLLPDAIIHRPKSGMMVPVQLGFREHWQRQAKALLLSRKAEIAPYLNQALIRDWLNYRGDTWNRYGVKLWLLVSLEYWLQSHRSN
ncbi:MAG: asparagine synthase-related protein [Leptolyngbyaceae cyanobacterium bins.302]|nr:asparagine synthase-related protein [Leptolyngbyaceae cyanobacterium bins.302]